MLDPARNYTAHEVAEALGISVDKVYRRINRGDLPANLVRERSVHYRVRGADLLEYIEAGQSDKLSPPKQGDQQMLGVPEVARMTGFAVETVRRMCYDGRLPYVRGASERGHLRIPRAAVQELLGRHTASV